MIKLVYDENFNRLDIQVNAIKKVISLSLNVKEVSGDIDFANETGISLISPRIHLYVSYSKNATRFPQIDRVTRIDRKL